MKAGTALLIVQCVLIVALVVPFAMMDSGVFLLWTPINVVAIAAVAYARTIVKNKSRKAAVGAENAKVIGKLKHIEGLPFAKDVVVDIYYTPQEIVFNKDTQTIKLQCGKINSIDCVSSKDAATSLAGAAGGLILGGALGAAIGATVEAYFLVITYVSDGVQKHITFEDNKQTLFAAKIAKSFRADHPKENSVVEL